MYTAQCKMLLFYAKTIVKESHNFELAHLKKKKKKEEKHFRDFFCVNIYCVSTLISLHIESTDPMICRQYIL